MNALLESVVARASEFAHPNFCSNKTAFTVDKATGRMVLRNSEEVSTADLIHTFSALGISGGLFAWLLSDFSERVKANFPDEDAANVEGPAKE